MQYLQHSEAGKNEIVIEGKQFLHVFVSRRLKLDDEIRVQKFNDTEKYIYKVTSLQKKRASLRLARKENLAPYSCPTQTVALAITDPKDLKEAVRLMAQIGQSKFIFFYAERSQQNYKIKSEKLLEIVTQSFELSGNLCEPRFEIYKSLQDLFDNNLDKSVYMLDFDGATLDDKLQNLDILLVGPEGGFTKSERELMQDKILSFKSSLTLSAKAAAVAAASKLFL